MQHYFFHLHNGHGATPDPTGRYFRSLEEARIEALRDIRSIVSDEAREGLLDLRGRIDITIGETVVRTVRFPEAFDLKLAE